MIEKDRGNSSWPHYLLADYVRTKPELSAALGGKLNLFRFFLVKAAALLRRKGKFGLIVPLAILADINCAKTRFHLITSLGDLTADCFPQKDNPSRRIFSGAKLSTVILTGTRE